MPTPSTSQPATGFWRMPFAGAVAMCDRWCGVHRVIQVMELELIEPELLFELAPLAADRLADLLVSG